MRYQLKLWDSKRERINLGKALNLGTTHPFPERRTEQFQRRASCCGPAHPPPEAGGRGEGKGANLAPEMAPLTKLQTDLQSLTKDFLRFWMVDIRRED